MIRMLLCRVLRSGSFFHIDGADLSLKDAPLGSLLTANRGVTMTSKLLCMIAMFAVCAAVGIAQDERVDVVYLTDGSVIRGMIIEQIPNKKLKIETRDGSIFAIDFSRIQKITKEQATPSRRSGGNSSSSGTRMVASFLIGGLIYEDFFFATGARLGASIGGMVYVGMVVTSTFGDVTGVYFGGELGFNANIQKVTVQPYISVGLGSVAGESALCLGPGLAVTYWAAKDFGIGPDVKGIFIPDAEDFFGLVHLSLVYRF
jgi:hypothetical protein